MGPAIEPLARRGYSHGTGGSGSGEAPGLFDPVFPHDGQSEDHDVAGQDQPMAECQGVAIDRSQGQRDLVVVRHEVSDELERARHFVDRVEKPPK